MGFFLLLELGAPGVRVPAFFCWGEGEGVRGAGPGVEGVRVEEKEGVGVGVVGRGAIAG